MHAHSVARAGALIVGSAWPQHPPHLGTVDNDGCVAGPDEEDVHHKVDDHACRGGGGGCKDRNARARLGQGRGGSDGGAGGRTQVEPSWQLHAAVAPGCRVPGQYFLLVSTILNAILLEIWLLILSSRSCSRAQRTRQSAVHEDRAKKGGRGTVIKRRQTPPSGAGFSGLASLCRALGPMAACWGLAASWKQPQERRA